MSKVVSLRKLILDKTTLRSLSIGEMGLVLGAVNDSVEREPPPSGDTACHNRQCENSETIRTVPVPSNPGPCQAHPSVQC